MNKAEFVEKLGKKAELTKKDAAKATDAMLDLITGALAKNEPVLLTGFGKFEARTRKSNKANEPTNGTEDHGSSKGSPGLQGGEELKDDRCQEGEEEAVKGY